MTLELKQKNKNPYSLGGVQEIVKGWKNAVHNSEKESGDYFSITIFDLRIFATEVFEYVKDKDTGEYFVKNGEWIYKK